MTPQGALLFASVLVGVFVVMEGVAFLMHKHVMHGPLWVLHRSHHHPRASAWFEANDLFGIFFALPSMLLIHLGVRGQPLLLAAGLGMTAYGAAYFVFHDVIVHRRVRTRFVPRSAYLRRIVRAHLLHHKTLTKHGARSFSFLWAAPDGRG
jgi:beta-carotene 3-hydroxylase